MKKVLVVYLSKTGTTETMESRFKMTMTNLGPFDLEGGLMEKEQDMHTCQDYGKSVAAMLGPLQA